MGKFVTKTGNDGQFYFSLKADNGQVIISSQGYTTAAALQNGIKSMKTNAPEDTRYERLNASNDKFYFNLKAPNGQVIGKSQMYESEAGRDQGIESVKANAPGASTE
ncbi:MAG TPA: YegP family protein [Agriterribacter sp.]|nr:YegP family protein [Agriterribacter sp.]